ncbi:hypothetical protein UA08_08172 [Talaromyces atroroseus]|uniref:Inner kinetochore subunit AME1 domain-containing protein n=1 Tax=Talaromyces atroroseus TaxID=1441469 RepID=A0A225APX5_TALAT|nr:hypothetical protein UA08_08172 [Talaromyces atroroseus]OKL56475.1 hypothetical protein UA08_08172 [Talaromyces atroroseus]
MASNREERLQMRQRGAGTRKVQAVDFGFSFGSPPAAGQSTSIVQNGQAAPPEEGTNGIDSLVAKALTPPVNDESSTRIPTPTTRTPRTSIAATHSPRRSSARKSDGGASVANTVDEQEEGRSSKRRRISTENDRLTSTSSSKSTPVANPPLSATRADSQQIESPSNGIVDGLKSPELAIATDSAAVDQTEDNDVHETVNVEQQAEPEQEIVRTARRGRPKTITSTPQEDINRRASEAGKQPAKGQGGVNGSEPRENQEESQSKPPNRKRRRGLAKQPSGEDGAEDDRESEGENVESGANKRRQKLKDAEPEPEREQDGEEDSVSTQQVPRGKRKSLGRPARNVESEKAQHDDTAAQTRRKRKGKQKDTEENAETVDVQNDIAAEQGSRESEARKKQPESGAPRRRGRPSLDKAQQPQPEAKTTTEPTEDTEKQPETSTEQRQATKRRRGRAPGVANGKETTSRQHTRQRDTQDETTEGEREKRRTGGTVSITVHRLANTRALESHAEPDSSTSDHEQDSSDELQLEVTGKNFPSRTGVNAADVLSQICKEILDKHVTALDTNIANDTASQSKRSEYVRQRKAVEAYGSQLEGRLFELSELLDSNFALGVQLKKAKREAAEMRNRLLAVRQQRHEVTLQMDAVRRKHGEEENAKMSRDSINNALHNLELTLDRNRVRPNDDSEAKDTGIAGLEFLLRSVSDNVSSAAEGSQGGLLNQVKTFNAQLERAAKKLER